MPRRIRLAATISTPERPGWRLSQWFELVRNVFPGHNFAALTRFDLRFNYESIHAQKAGYICLRALRPAFWNFSTTLVFRRFTMNWIACYNSIAYHHNGSLIQNAAVVCDYFSIMKASVVVEFPVVDYQTCVSEVIVN